MLTDIDKLVKYFKQAIELNELNRNFDEEDSYDSVNLTISPSTIIQIEKQNKEGNDADIKKFAFQKIGSYIEKDRKKILYRKQKLAENKDKP